MVGKNQPYHHNSTINAITIRSVAIDLKALTGELGLAAKCPLIGLAESVCLVVFLAEPADTAAKGRIGLAIRQAKSTTAVPDIPGVSAMRCTPKLASRSALTDSRLKLQDC
jgi:hypothetical protein